MTTHGKGRPSASHRAPAGAKAAKPKARCVLWCAPGSRPEPELVEALHKRSEFETEVVNSGYEAFAVLCQRAAQAKSTGDPAVLLLVEPAKLSGAVRVMESAAIYAAASSTWAYDRSAPERLRGVSIEDVAAMTQAHAGSHSMGQPAHPWPGKPTESHTEVKVAGVITGPRPARISTADAGIISSSQVPIDPPQLRLTGGMPIGDAGGDASPATPDAAEPAPSPASHLLTDEELAMLLASEPDDDGRR